MNNSEIINNMLKQWAQIYRENPDKTITYKHFYKKLIITGVKKEDLYKNIRNLTSEKYPNLDVAPRVLKIECNTRSIFSNWTQWFADSPNTYCYFTQEWENFCQFISTNNDYASAKRFIKIYVPMDYEHIEEGARQLFSFIDQKGISHSSKIASEIRFDGVTIRVTKKEDADEIIKYVNSNQYIQEGLIQPNPFCFQKDGIALAEDGRQNSYNEVISHLMKTYMDYCRDNNRLDVVNTEDFYNFIKTKFTQQFIDHSNNDLKTAIAWNENEENDYRDIISLIIKVHDSSFSYEDFIEHYKTCSKIENQEENQNLLIEALIIDVTEAFTRELGFSKALKALDDYFYLGNSQVSSNKEIYNRLEKINFRKKVSEILQKLALYDFRDYVINVLKENSIDLTEIHYISRK